MSSVQLFYLPPNICLILFINGNSNFNVFTFYVTLSLVQVQSYSLNREHYRRKVALEIRNKKGKLRNLGFLKQERTRNILCL